MRLHLNLPINFHLGNSSPKVAVIFNSAIQTSKKPLIVPIKKMKVSLRKLSPFHWYDGVWNDLDYKM